MSRNHNGGSGYLRVLFLAVLVIGLGIAGTVIVMRDRTARSGQIYALDLDSGAQVWQHAFPGVSPSLIQEVFHDALRHRVGLTYEAEAEGLTSDKVLDQVLIRTPVPAQV